MPARDANAIGLLQGLAALNPVINDYFKIEQARQVTDAEKQAAVDVQRMADPRTALSGPIEGPADAPPAFASTYRTELQKGLANRAASEIKTETLAAYAEDSMKPDFEPISWLADKRTKAMAGVSDPTAQAIIGAHFGTLEEQLRMEASRKNMQRLQEVNASTAAAYAAESFSGNMKPEELGAAYPLFLEKAKGLGYSAKEANQMMFQQLEHESNKLGGSPELFDVFDQKGPDGQTIRFHHPELMQHIDQAKAKASQARQKAINDQAEHGNAATLMGYESALETNPFAITPEMILAHQTSNGPFQTKEAAASMWAKVLNARHAKLEVQQTEHLFDTGELWRVDAKVQDKILTTRLAPAIEALSQATRTGDPAGAAQVGAQIMQAQSRSGSTVPSDQVARYIKTLVTNLPSSEGASPAFNTAAALYKSMSANPAYRDMYFDEKTAKILDAYNSASGNGTDPKAAYTQAYQSVSPQAQAAADAFVRTPEFQKKVATASKKWAEGSSFLPQWLGGNGRPQNERFVSAAVISEMRSWFARNPFATDEQANDYAQSWTRNNFVLDTVGRTAVQIPPGIYGPAAREALTDFSKKAGALHKLDERSDGDWSVRYTSEGTEGYYTAVLFNGAQTHYIGRISLHELIAKQAAAKLLNPEERQVVGQARREIDAGLPLSLSPEMLAKATTAKGLDARAMGVYMTQERAKLTTLAGQVPSFNFGRPTFDNLQFTRKGPTVDNQLTARSALDLARPALEFAGDPATKHVGLAASMITMGEAVALTRYPDPAKGAGFNIGMGYNLTANKANAEGDLVRAGVPKERVKDVIEGRASLTQKQAERLLLVALPRYEKEVQQTAEATSPGLWDKRMTPAQKAVMIDVAWQVGDIAQFKKAWASLAAGDAKAFAEQTKVTYVNQAGTRVEDTRRNNLRASMLAGFSQWEATVQQFGKLPSSKLQAALLKAPTNTKQ